MKTFHRIGWGSRIRTYDVRVKVWCLSPWRYPSIRIGALKHVGPFRLSALPKPIHPVCSVRQYDAGRTWDLGLCSYLHYTPILKHLINFLRTVIRTATPVQIELGQLRKFIISTWWELNPRTQLGRLVFYHWTTRANWPFLHSLAGQSGILTTLESWGVSCYWTIKSNQLQVPLSHSGDT